jgi:hypothetical protein
MPVSAAHSAATSPHAIALRGAIGAAHGTGGSSAYTEQPARVSEPPVERLPDEFGFAVVVAIVFCVMFLIFVLAFYEEES